MKRSLFVAPLIVLAAIAALAIPAVAQDTEPPADEATEAAETAEQKERHPGHLDRRAEMQELLAEELGIEVEELEAAMGRVRERLEAERLERFEEMLGDKVAAGELTREQADALLELRESGDWPGPRGGKHGPRPGRR